MRRSALRSVLWLTALVVVKTLSAQPADGMVSGADIVMPPSFAPYADINDYVESIGGFIEIAADAASVVRVPAASFAETVAHIESLGGRATVRAAAGGEHTELSFTSLAEFPRISIFADSANGAAGGQRLGIPHEWIARLNPFSADSVGRASWGIYAEIPGDFVVYERGFSWFAEHPSGMRLRIGGFIEPDGEVAYWQGELVRFLAPHYGWYSEFDAGLFGGAMFFSPGQGYVYIVAVATVDLDLVIAEVLVPITDDMEAHLDQALALIGAIQP